MAASLAFDFSVFAWILASRSVLACPPAVDPASKACTLPSKVVTFGVSALIAVSLASDFCLFVATCASLVLSTVSLILAIVAFIVRILDSTSVKRDSTSAAFTAPTPFAKTKAATTIAAFFP